MENKITPLPLRFTKNGFLYWQVCRTDKAAIYEQKEIETGRVWFEVWKIRARGSFTFDGRQYPAMEREPGATDWGRYGWTFYTMPDARKRYDLINGRGIAFAQANARISGYGSGGTGFLDMPPTRDAERG